MRRKLFLLTIGPLAVAIGILALRLRTIPYEQWSACLLCVWRDLPPNIRTAISVATSLDAIGGALGAQVGEQLGGSFGRGFGQSLGEKFGKGELAGVAMGGMGAIEAIGSRTVIKWAAEQGVDQIKQGAQDKAIDLLLGDKAIREQEALEWLNRQMQ